MGGTVLAGNHCVLDPFAHVVVTFSLQRQRLAEAASTAAGWHTPLILALEKQAAPCEFETSLVHIASARQARAGE